MPYIWNFQIEQMKHTNVAMQHANIYSGDAQVAWFVSLETLKSLLEFKKFKLWAPQVDVGEILREVKGTGTCWCSRQQEVSG